MRSDQRERFTDAGRRPAEGLIDSGYERKHSAARGATNGSGSPTPAAGPSEAWAAGQPADGTDAPEPHFVTEQLPQTRRGAFENGRIE